MSLKKGNNSAEATQNIYVFYGIDVTTTDFSALALSETEFHPACCLCIRS